MAYTSTELVTESYHLSGVVSRDFETATGDQIGEGIKLLNDLLADKTADEKCIPYFTTQFQFPAVIGQQKYFIPDLVEIETLVFFIGSPLSPNSVRYAMICQPRGIYFGASRAENIESLPFNYHWERCFGGANIFLYFLPEQAYTMELSGLFRLAAVVYGQDLSLTIDRFYINYLKYQLAERICDTYSYVVPPNVEKRLSYYNLIIEGRMGKMDLRQQSISLLDGPLDMVNYGQVNLGKGWNIP